MQDPRPTHDGHPWPCGTSACAHLIRDTDWAATPLGPAREWPASLRAVVDMLLACNFPMVALWGADLVQLYNDGYAEIMGAKHPGGMGQPTRDCWPEVWNFNAPIYDRVRSGETLTYENQLFPIARRGFLEDAFFTLCYSPLRDESTAIAGVLVTVFETTARVLADRRQIEVTLALQASEDRLRTLVSARADSIYRMSPDWRFMYQLDSGTLANTTEPIEDWVQKYILEEDLPEVYGAIRHAIDTRSLFELEHRVRLADGSVGWVFSRAVPVLDTDGSILEWFGTGRDVTERKRAEETLRASEERQAFLLRLSDVLRPLTDAAEIQNETTRLLGEHLDVDRCYYFETDHQTGEYIIRRDFKRGNLRSLVGRHPIQQWPQMTAALRCGEQLVVNDYAHSADTPPEERPPTEDLDIRAIILMPLIKNGILVACMAVIQTVPRIWKNAEVALVADVAERTWAAVERGRAETAQRESEEKFRTMSNLAPALIWFNDAAGANTFINDQFEQYTGKTREQIAGGGWRTIVHPEDASLYVASYFEAVRSHRAWSDRARLRRADGTWQWFDHQARPLFTEDGAFLGHVGASIDISSTVETEQTLRETLGETQAELRALTRHLLTVLEEERRTVAQDIHDSLGQRAALLGLEVGQLERKIDELPGGAKAILARMRNHIAELSLEIHEVSHGLHPAFIADLGLPAALRALAEEHQHAGANIKLSLAPCPPLPIHASTAMYRIAQEALSNSIKHAFAAPISLSLRCEHQNLIIEIKDEGPGFDLSTTRAKGRLGLVGMQQRASLLGGQLVIDTAPGQGTRTTAIFPLAALGVPPS